MQLSNNNLHDLKQANSFLIATSVKNKRKERLFATKATTFVMWNCRLKKFAKTLPRQMSKKICCWWGRTRPSKAEQGRNSCWWLSDTWRIHRYIVVRMRTVIQLPWSWPEFQPGFLLPQRSPTHWTIAASVIFPKRCFKIIAGKGPIRKQ